MLAIGRQKIDPLILFVLAIVGVVAMVLAVEAPTAAFWVIVAAAGFAVMVYWSARWEITLWTWIWLLSYGIVGRGFWLLETPGFFNMTIPRFLFMAAVTAFALHFLFRKGRIHYDRAVFGMMALLLIYCAASATAAGWTVQSPDNHALVPPYFRFLAGMLFPFVMFFLVYNATRSDRQIAVALTLVTLYGWYALYISYLQYAASMGMTEARAFIWPNYINDVEFGLHFDRSRGAFFSTGPQSVLLVVLFFTDLFLIGRIRGFYRYALGFQALLVIPAIFFTGLRAAYVGFLVCGAVWCLWGDSGRFGKLKLAAGVIAVAIGVTVFWSNLIQTDRRTGGVAQVGPVETRIALTEVTWQIAKQHPFTGVGFGHFIEARQELERDPTARPLPPVTMQHNVFLNMLTETGFIGLFGLLAVYILTFAQSLKLYRKLPVRASGMLSRPFVVLFWVVMVNYLIAAMFREVTVDAFSTSMLWSVAGLVVGYNRLLEPALIDLPIAGPVGPEAKVVSTPTC